MKLKDTLEISDTYIEHLGYIASFKRSFLYAMRLFYMYVPSQSMSIAQCKTHGGWTSNPTRTKS